MREKVDSKRLPEMCFFVGEDGDLRQIQRGIEGFFVMCVQLRTKELNQRKANKLNADLGVTKRQVSAMVYGSLYGWDSPGANPNGYTVSGMPVFRR